MQNVYIKALEIGNANPNGIKYSELKSQIKSETNIEFDSNLEVGFLKWIVGAFEISLPKSELSSLAYNASVYLRQGDKVSPIYNDAYKKNSGQTLVIKGNTTKQYLDYLELYKAEVLISVYETDSINLKKS